jgi:GT2 family glycosyltransferase
MPTISVIILNYNGARWLHRCLSSLQAQTIFSQLEVIIADNASTDGSDHDAAQALASWPNGRFIQHGSNLGFCEGNNRAALQAQGQYLFFLNNDTWLEPDCLEILLRETQSHQAHAATPIMLNYEDDSVQSAGAAGFDAFGLMSFALPQKQTEPIFVAGGCCYLIERPLFEKLGGFDPTFYLYAEEYDLSWRLWLSGHKAVAVPSARLHHRTAATTTATGQSQIQTNDSRRYYTNRNGLWVIAKNAQHLLLLLLPLQLALLTLEALASLVLVRRLSFIQRAYLHAVRDAWRALPHIRAERQRFRSLRQRSDLWMLRFFKLRLNRWDSFLFLRRHGLPKVNPR